MRIRRLVSTVAVGAIVAGALVAGPAEAAKKCKAYKASGDGAGQPVVKVTDAATESKPVEVTLATGPGLGFSSEEGASGDTGPTSHAYANLQVDSKAPQAGLYVQAEFTPAFDYDLFVRDSYGTALDYSAGFGPVTSGSDRAESGVGTETVKGTPVLDCQGILIDVSSATTPGGDITLRYWLGK